MSFIIVADGCITCGFCEFGCPTDAIHKPAVGADSPAFWIETNRCNDCGWCEPICPAFVIHQVPESVICHGHGCPVAPETKGAFAGWECTELLQFCPTCGDVLHRENAGDEWVCVQCDLKQKAHCPKARQLTATGTSQPLIQYSREDMDRLRKAPSP